MKLISACLYFHRRQNLLVASAQTGCLLHFTKLNQWYPRMPSRKAVSWPNSQHCRPFANSYINVIIETPVCVFGKSTLWH